MPIQTLNPATGEVVRTFAALEAEALRQRVQQAAEAFREHRALPLDHRVLLIRKLASLLDEEREELAQVITLEMGKPIAAARAEIDKCAALARYVADFGPRALAPEPIIREAGRAFLQFEPMGVLLAVMPWNFPFWQVLRFALPALLAGNVVLLKHAPSVPQCALLLEALIRRAGFVRGTLSALLITEAQALDVLSDDAVVGVTVTGGEAAGRAFASRAGALLKKVTLEMGGSDPLLVLPTANLHLAVTSAVGSRTVNSGQSCIAAKRIIVHSEVYDEFLQAFVTAMAALRVGDPLRDDTQVGPLGTPGTVLHLQEQVKAAVAAGARVLTGGKPVPGRGLYFQPTVLVDLPRTAKVYREEFFGPVALVFRAADLDEAIEIANDTPFGLGASVWTGDPGDQQRALREIAAGMVFLNSVVASEPALPFGGTKRSGFGRELGVHGTREFTSIKTVVLA